MPDEQPSFEGNAINSPDISVRTMEPRVRAIRNGDEAGKLIKNIIQQNKERNVRNARIMAKYNSEKPHSQSALEANGVGWKANFSTKPLPILIDKVAPRFGSALESAKYLTNSAFPEDHPGGDIKTTAFRREVTRTIRGRRGWRNFVNSLAQENALFGYAAAAWLDEVTWFPSFFRQDAFFVPVGTKQDVESAQLVVLKEDFLLHELFEKIEDKEAAETAGWDLENTVNAINNATPKRRDQGQNADWAREYEDLIRETSICTSYEDGAKIVTVYNLLVTEVTGKVSHYRVEDAQWTILFERTDRFGSMAEAVSFFSFQQGNGTMHGSKGIGREIYTIAGILDRTRNDIVDRLSLAGKLLIQGDPRHLKRFRMSLVGNAILIGDGYSISENRIDGNVEPFLLLDQYLTSIIDQIAGAASPTQLKGERVTAAQVNLVAGREEEQRDVILTRFLNQFADFMQTMQKRMVDPETIEPDAKAMQKRLLEVMTREELNQIAESPVAATVEDYSDVERQQIALIAAENAGNPLVNQVELKRRQLTAQVNEEFAEAVMMPENDPTQQAEQQRLQQLELSLLIQGQEVPVSPRDDAKIHLTVLQAPLEQAAVEVAQNPETLPILEVLVAHASQHVALALEHGKSKDEFSQEIALLEQATQAIEQIKQLNAEQAALGQQADQLAAGALPAP